MPTENGPTPNHEWSPKDSQYSLENLLPTEGRICEVEQEAVDQLVEWGVPAEKIDDLARLSAQYDYDNCLVKLGQIADRGGYITTIEGKDAVVLPDFIDLENRKTGQCIEIADKVLRDMHKTGWLNEVNSAVDAAGKPKLYPSMVSGNSRTHFQNNTDAHTWVGLAPTDTPIGEMITIDGSFLEISKQDTNGYKPHTILRDPTGSERNSNLMLRLGDIDYDDETYRSSTTGPVVIGLTTDRTMVLCLGFSIDRGSENGDQIRPVIQLQAADSEDAAQCLRIPGRGIVWADNSHVTDSAIRAEAEQALVLAEKIALTEDTDAGRRYREETTSINFQQI